MDFFVLFSFINKSFPLRPSLAKQKHTQDQAFRCCFELDKENDLLYLGSWDKTLKVWRILDSNCLESIVAHDDALNSVVARFGCFVFTGSTDGTVKMWKREFNGKGKIKLVLDRVLLKQENAMTALAVNHSNTVLYGGSSDRLVNF